MAGYIGSKASVVSNGAERKKVFDITATTTSLTGCSYTPNQVHVFHNGVRLVDGTDYTATDGSTVTLTTAAQSGDEVVVISYATFQTSDTVSASAGGTFTGDVTFNGAFTSRGIDDNATSTAMTLDTSGNLLVAKTASSLSTTGVQLNAEGSLSAVKAGTTSYFNRLTTDGEVTRFLKDGTTVGSIGAKSGNYLYMGCPTATDTYVGFVNGTFRPATSAGEINDDAINLGLSNSRWKDLYLSGGVYLGGTGSANYLDDYEEGTYSAYMYDALSGGNFVSLGTGYYTKIGNLVTFHFRDSNINTSGLTGTNAAYFSVPFASSSDFGGPCGHSLFRDVNWAGTQTAVSSYLGAGESAFRLYVQGDNVGYTSLKVNEFASGAADIYFTGSYFSA